MILTALRSGLKGTWKTKRLLLVLYLAGLLPALVVALPLRSVLLSFAGHSLAGTALLDGATVDFLAELVTVNRAASPTLLIILVVSAVAFWFMSLFLSGGALAILALGERYQAVEFWKGAAMFFGRFLRLSLWSLLLLAVLSLLPIGARVVQQLVFGSDPYQYVSYWGIWIQVGIVLFALFFFRVCFDYARIQAVLTEERRTRRSLWQGLRFVVRHPVRAIGLAVCVSLLGWAALLAAALSGAFTGSTTTLVLTGIVARQLCVFWGVAMRITRYGSEMALFGSIPGSPRSLTVTAPVPAPPEPVAS